MAIPSTMKGVTLTAPYHISIQEHPTPKIEMDGDAIIRVHLAGLCGSDLHWYRGHQLREFEPFIMGHEALGEIVAVGKDVKHFKPGDMAISPFSLSCGHCFYCKLNYTARCESQISIGNPTVPGAQAEYLRIAMADSSLFHLPTDLPKELCLVMTDILPTGFSTAMNARRLADEDRTPHGPQTGTAGPLSKRGVCLVVGCGPVGLCAITSATTLFEHVFATDLSAARLELAKKHGAQALQKSELVPALMSATEGRGADAVLELVGVQAALDTALELVRPYGVVSVGGVHTKEIKLPGLLLYGKNVRMQFGRCSHHTFYEPALQVLRDNRDLFSDFVENFISWDEAAEFYRLFEQNKVSKTTFVAFADASSRVSPFS